MYSLNEKWSTSLVFWQYIAKMLFKYQSFTYSLLMRTGVQSTEFLELCQVQMVTVNLTLEFPDFHICEILVFNPILKGGIQFIFFSLKI